MIYSIKYILVAGLLFSLLATFSSCGEYEELLPENKELNASEAYSALGSATGGETNTINNSGDLPSLIIEILGGNVSSNTDVVFLIDNTGSMKNDIIEVKSALSNIIAELPNSTRLGAATYNDNNGNPVNWYEHIDLNIDHYVAGNFIQSIDISNAANGDVPESVYDGIYETVERMSWSSSNDKVVIVIGDAPPLQGSLTNHSLADVIEKCQDAGLEVNLYPILIED